MVYSLVHSQLRHTPAHTGNTQALQWHTGEPSVSLYKPVTQSFELVDFRDAGNRYEYVWTPMDSIVSLWC